MDLISVKLVISGSYLSESDKMISVKCFNDLIYIDFNTKYQQNKSKWFINMMEKLLSQSSKFNSDQLLL